MPSEAPPEPPTAAETDLQASMAQVEAEALRAAAELEQARQRYNHFLRLVGMQAEVSILPLRRR